MRFPGLSTTITCGHHLEMQSDGNLVIYSGCQPTHMTTLVATLSCNMMGTLWFTHLLEYLYGFQIGNV